MKTSRQEPHPTIDLDREPGIPRDGRVDQLLDAVQVIGSGLELQDVLRRIVEVAVSLVDAEFGALGVVDASGDGLSQFVTVGMDDDLIARIGDMPTGRGVLGEVIHHPQPVRLEHLAAHSASSGFPADHPPMSSFLGVPVRVSDIVFGNLYLTEKRGGGPFDSEDESIVVALARAAGVAIHNVRLYDESRRQRSWLEAGREISTALMSGTDRGEVMQLAARRAREVLGATTVLTAFRQQGRLQVEASAGIDAAGLAELEPALLSALATGDSEEIAVGSQFGVRVPLGPPGSPGDGVLVALWPGRPTVPSRANLRDFATRAALALELADRRDAEERSAVVEDRDRIGRDLHDLVIQRLFATGMQLQSAVRLVGSDPEQATGRINQSVDDLDETIRELRSTIYGLQAPVQAQPSLRAQILEVVDAGSAHLGFAATLHLSGLLDTTATPDVAEHVVATLREALSNAARHAHAHAVDVVVAMRGDDLQVRVQDDGCGMTQDGVRRGLRNLAVRAERLGGTLRVTSVPEEGTTLLWQVPV